MTSLAGTSTIVAIKSGGRPQLPASQLLVEHRPDQIERGPPRLTPRQIDVLCWMVRGKTNAEIADVLSLSVRTAEQHVEGIFGTLGVNWRGEATGRVRRLSPQSDRGRRA
jgi:DNA-binding NarL/FixJ family response regulator